MVVAPEKIDDGLGSQRSDWSSILIGIGREDDFSRLEWVPIV